ncbi:MAG: mechanosensitive ion channel family protein [Syntrophomonadaceae bacterium]|nr:mechanosensitive ion channel family protein [Syntrophomonadaceae bacterium]
MVPLALILGFWLLGIVFSRFLLPLLLRYTSQTPSQLDEQVLTAFSRPIKAIVFIFGLYLTVLYLPLATAVDQLANCCFRTLLIILLAWGAHGMVGPGSIFSERLRDRFKIESVLIPSFSKALQFLIWAMALVLAAHEWDYDVNGFIAGLGLGGLAFALAAKDLLANIFGGVVIIMEKPFVLGDWVETKSVEGMVEEISFRSTRFRTFTQALVTVPNSTLADEAITNWSRMRARRVRFTLIIDYAGPRELIEECLQEIRSLIQNHPGIEPASVLVALENINVNGLEVLVQYFSRDTQTPGYMALKEDINYAILDILASRRLSLAAPGRVVYSPSSSEAKVK